MYKVLKHINNSEVNKKYLILDISKDFYYKISIKGNRELLIKKILKTVQYDENEWEISVNDIFLSSLINEFLRMDFSDDILTSTYFK
jgi:hypothetical protein